MFRIIFIIFLFVFSLPSFARYQEVDARAKDIPVQYEKNLPTLVNYLIRPYLKDEELKARAIYAWITYHIEYDTFSYDVQMDKKRVLRKNKLAKTGDAFKTRVGVCADIADLFYRMAKLAKLRSEEIVGYAGYDLTMDNFKDSKHAWNAVYINNKVFFVDATWGMQGDYRAFENVRTIAEHRKEIRKKRREKNKDVSTNRSIDNHWFLVEPKEMIKTHFPEREKHQYLKPAVDMKKVFRENGRRLEKRKK